MTIQEFIDKHQVKMVATFLGAGPDYGEGFSDDPRATHWSLRLTVPGGAMRSEWHAGAAHWRWKLKPGYTGQFFHDPGKGSLWAGAKRGEPVPYHSGRMSLYDEAFLKEFSEPTPPTIEDVLENLAAVARASAACPRYEDWAAWCGYDEDSREGERVFHACVAQHHKLFALLGRGAFDELLEVDFDSLLNDVDTV